MKKSYVIICSLVAILEAGAQIGSVFSDRQNLLSINPSFAGSNGFLRNQISFSGPFSNFSRGLDFYRNGLDMYLRSIKGGVGFIVSSERVGAISRSEYGVAYAQHMSFGGGHKLVPSVHVAYVKSRFFDEWIGSPYTPVDPNRKFLSMRAGLLYSYSGRLFAGGTVSTFSKADEYNNATAYARFSFYSSYNLFFARRSVLNFNLRAEQRREEVFVLLNASALFGGRIIASAGYNSNDILHFQAGYRINWLNMTAGFNKSLGRVPYNVSTWEVNCLIGLKRKGQPRTHLSFEEM